MTQSICGGSFTDHGEHADDVMQLLPLQQKPSAKDALLSRSNSNFPPFRYPHPVQPASPSAFPMPTPTLPTPPSAPLPSLTPSLQSHLRASLPLLKLAQTPHAPVRQAIARLLAQKQLNVRFSQELPEELVDDVSIWLAQSAATDCEELAEVWNLIVKEEFHADGYNLAEQIDEVRRQTVELKKEGAQLDDQIQLSRNEAIRMTRMALEKSLSAVETDAEERMGESADLARVRMLAAKGLATGGKLKVVREEVEAIVYGGENGKGVARVKDELERRIRETKQKLHESESKLREYRGCGEEFEKVVDEISRLRQVMEQKVWERNQLHM